MRADKRVPVLIAAVAVTVGLAACSTLPPPVGSAEAAVAEASAVHDASMLERLYWRTDANHDWRLTREEAREHLPVTYAEYDRIDVDKRGWISLEQYLEFHEARAKRLAEGI